MKIAKNKIYGKDPELEKDLKQVFEVLQKKVSFKDNISGAEVSFVSSGTADTENTISHNLKKIPTGFIKISQDKPCSVYKGSTLWTKDKIYLKVNVASANITIFLI